VRSLRSLILREDRVCPWWLAYTFDNPLRRFLHDPVKLLAPYVHEGMTVADIGCGMGYFTVGLAGLVGEQGTVFATDLQQEMLDRTAQRVKGAGVAQQVRLVRCAPDDIGVPGPVDFALAFWMAHETEDTGRFFRQVRAVLSAGGRMLVVEPTMHVNRRRFQEELQAARDAGLRELDAPSVRLSRAVLLGRE
jgi:ubiquinone/menaquinone biosynthesis C-methylase UbiE